MIDLAEEELVVKVATAIAEEVVRQATEATGVDDLTELKRSDLPIDFNFDVLAIARVALKASRTSIQ